MKVLVCGGREYTDDDVLGVVLDGIPITLLIHGGAPGADTLSGRWAEKTGHPQCVFPANWYKFGKKAGPLRNNWMLRFGDPDLVVAFPGGTGTAHMVKIAKLKGVKVIEVPG